MKTASEVAQSIRLVDSAFVSENWRRVEEAIRADRRAVIEACAKIANEYGWQDFSPTGGQVRKVEAPSYGSDIATAIRALAEELCK